MACVFAVLFAYQILTIDYNAIFYNMGLQRAGSNYEFDTVMFEKKLYIVVYESEDKLYLTECYYTDSGECMHILADSRMCIGKTGVTIERFPAYGGSESNFDDYIVPIS